MPGPTGGTTSPHALGVFQSAATRVPAYRSFLAEHGVRAADVRGDAALREVPVTTKANYVDRWPLQERLLDGTWSNVSHIARSSGSAGRVRDWPRGHTEAEVGADCYEDVIAQATALARPGEAILAVVGFALGTWIAGVYTAVAIAELGRRGVAVVTVTPGNDAASIIDVLRELAPSFGATVLFGYPPFIRDVLEQAAQRVDLAPLKLSLALSGEPFSEPARDAMTALIGASGQHHRVRGVYGAADTGLIGVESRETIAVRRRLDASREARVARFGAPGLPSLFRVRGEHRTIHADAGRLLFTAGGKLPLVRYELGDAGLDVADLMSELGRPVAGAAYIGLSRRMDVSAIFHGANLYPEDVRLAVSSPVLLETTTGRFAMVVLDDGEGRPRLEVRLERRAGSGPPRLSGEAMATRVSTDLCELCSEYADVVAHAGDRALLSVSILEPGDPTFSADRGKQRLILDQ